VKYRALLEAATRPAAKAEPSAPSVVSDADAPKEESDGCAAGADDGEPQQSVISSAQKEERDAEADNGEPQQSVISSAPKEERDVRADAAGRESPREAVSPAMAGAEPDDADAGLDTLQAAPEQVWSVHIAATAEGCFGQAVRFSRRVSRTLPTGNVGSCHGVRLGDECDVDSHARGCRRGQARWVTSRSLTLTTRRRTSMSKTRRSPVRRKCLQW
jgi:hypothetical protein